MELSPLFNSSQTFTTFGDLLKYLRRRARLTQLELSIAVGYSEAQISRLEQNQRLPDITAVQALFIPALHLENEPQLTARFLELARSARQEDAPSVGIPPYRGLLFFDEADAELFFGRETLTAHLAGHVMDLAKDASTRFLTVVGASGSGKSSLIRAGLAVALKRVGWDVRLFTPTSVPIWSMERNLSSMSMPEKERVLILVDQFEEVFTLCRDEIERINFIEQLVSIAQEKSRKSTVVIALRADFYSHCAQYPLLRKVVAEEQEYIGQMTADELRCAIEEPARRGGWELESGLVDVLLQDVGARGSHEPEPGALPLLSHALLATWQRRRGRTLTLQGYRASGGVRGAIAETAESVFTDQLNQAEQKLARDVFLRLTELGEGTEDTRRRATLNELVRQSSEAALLRAVLDTLAEARLIILNENSAEVAHEALIREWQRLHEWLTQDREGLLLHRHLTESAHEWETRGHDSSDLYRGVRLAQAREWKANNEERLNDSERTFLAASIRQEEQDALEREAQRQRELMAAQELANTQSRAATQLRRRALFLASAFVLAFVLAVATTFFWREASQNALEAQSRELAAAAVSNLGDDPERSILLALQAIKTSHTVEAENALHRSILESRVRLVLHHDAEVWSVAYSPDGKRIGTASQDKTAKIWDATTGELLMTLTGHTKSVNGIAFSPDGKRIATSSDDQTAKIWDAATGDELLTLRGHTNWVFRVAYSPDGKRIATASQDKTAKIWDVVTGKALLTIPSHGEFVYDVAFSPDGKRLATSGYNLGKDDANVRVWDADSGTELLTLPIGQGGSLRGVAFSPDGTHLVTTSLNFPGGRMWDAATGEILLNGFPDQTGGLLDIAYSSNGKFMATGGDDTKAKVRDTVSGQVFYTLSGHTLPINGVAFSPDGTRLATASWDHTARVWDITPASELRFVPISSPGSSMAAASPDGSRIMSVHPAENVVIIQDGFSGKELLKLQGRTGGLRGAVFSPNGKLIGAAYDDGAVLIWDAQTGKQLADLTRAILPTFGAFSPDGPHVASGYINGELLIWDVSSGKIIQTLQGPTSSSVPNVVEYSIQSLAYSPDGKYLISGDTNGFANIWDINTGKKFLVYSPEEEGPGVSLIPEIITSVAYSPDGKEVAIANDHGIVRLLNAFTGRERFTLKGHSAAVRTVIFSPDGKLIVTSSADATTRVWDATTGENVLMLPIAGNVSFLPNGKQLAISNDSGMYVFVLPIDDLVALAKSRVTRTLTTDECQQYLHVATCPNEE